MVVCQLWIWHHCVMFTMRRINVAAHITELDLVLERGDRL